MISASSIESFHHLLEGADRVLITTHINPDGDAIGSQACLAKFLRSLGKSVRIVNQDATPETLRFVEDPQTRAEVYEPSQHDDILREADPQGIPVPLLLSGATDGRTFSRFGIQTYGFLPMRLPEEFDFSSTVHAANERIPVESVGFGTDRICELLQRFGE